MHLCRPIFPSSNRIELKENEHEIGGMEGSAMIFQDASFMQYAVPIAPKLSQQDIVMKQKHPFFLSVLH